MKIVYCVSNIENSSGMERMTIDKANYLCDIKNYDVFIITTNVNGKDFFIS